MSKASEALSEHYRVTNSHSVALLEMIGLDTANQPQTVKRIAEKYALPDLVQFAREVNGSCIGREVSQQDVLHSRVETAIKSTNCENQVVFSLPYIPEDAVAILDWLQPQVAIPGGMFRLQSVVLQQGLHCLHASCKEEVWTLHTLATPLRFNTWEDFLIACVEFHLSPIYAKYCPSAGSPLILPASKGLKERLTSIHSAFAIQKQFIQSSRNVGLLEELKKNPSQKEKVKKLLDSSIKADWSFAAPPQPAEHLSQSLKIPNVPRRDEVNPLSLLRNIDPSRIQAPPLLIPSTGLPQPVLKEESRSLPLQSKPARNQTLNILAPRNQPSTEPPALQVPGLLGQPDALATSSSQKPPEAAKPSNPLSRFWTPLQPQLPKLDIEKPIPRLAPSSQSVQQHENAKLNLASARSEAHSSQALSGTSVTSSAQLPSRSEPAYLGVPSFKLSANNPLSSAAHKTTRIPTQSANHPLAKVYSHSLPDHGSGSLHMNPPQVSPPPLTDDQGKLLTGSSLASSQSQVKKTPEFSHEKLSVGPGVDYLVQHTNRLDGVETSSVDDTVQYFPDPKSEKKSPQCTKLSVSAEQCTSRRDSQSWVCPLCDYENPTAKLNCDTCGYEYSG